MSKTDVHICPFVDWGALKGTKIYTRIYRYNEMHHQFVGWLILINMHGSTINGWPKSADGQITKRNSKTQIDRQTHTRTHSQSCQFPNRVRRELIWTFHSRAELKIESKRIELIIDSATLKSNQIFIMQQLISLKLRLPGGANPLGDPH